MSRRDEFEWFAEWAVGTSPLYERLSRAVCEDEWLLELGDAASEGQPAPHLLFGAVHDRLLAGEDHPLRRFYASCVAEPVNPATEDPAPDFRALCEEHEDDLRPVIASRRVQTNSVRRSVALYPAFAALAREFDAPFSLVEVGCSGGLNLCWDRYAYDYDGTRVGVDSPCLLDTTLRGGASRIPLPAAPAAVRERVGIDVNPLDVSDDADARWLRALVWPEHVDRHRLLDAAIDVVREHPPRTVQGDAADELPDVLAALPTGPVVLVTTQVLYQLDGDARADFEAQVASLGAEYDLHWLSGDDSAEDVEQAIVLRHARSGEPRSDGDPLLTYDQHGHWIRWDA